MSQTATSSKLCSSARVKNAGTSALIIRSPAPTMATRTRPLAPITRSGRRILRLVSPAPAAAADVVRIKSLRVVLLIDVSSVGGWWLVAGGWWLATNKNQLPTTSHQPPLLQILIEPFPDRGIILFDSQPVNVRSARLNYQFHGPLQLFALRFEGLRLLNRHEFVRVAVNQ